jgi:hypothetical protein
VQHFLASFPTTAQNLQTWSYLTGTCEKIIEIWDPAFVYFGIQGLSRVPLPAQLSGCNP